MWGSGEDGSIRDECVRTSYVVMRGSCGLLVRLSATSRLWVGGRCVACTREAPIWSAR